VSTRAGEHAIANATVDINVIANATTRSVANAHASASARVYTMEI
jgi:hypothetical protein